MIEFCEKLISITPGLSEELLEDDWKTMYVLFRLFEVLGEAASKVTVEFRQAHPEIPWRSAITMRNRLIHSYDDIEYSIVMDALHNEIPGLLQKLQLLLAEM